MGVKKIRSKGRLARRILCVLLTLSFFALLLPMGAYAAQSSDAMSGGIEKNKYEDLKLCPGGFSFGVKLYTKGVLVVGLSGVMCNGRELQPARDAGIKVKDVIEKVGGVSVDSIREVSELISASDGKELLLTVSRNGDQMDIRLKPAKADEDGRYKAGMYLRDSTAGIGTVTYVNAETGEFGGLGHGICDIDTAELIPIKRGSAMKVRIGGVVKGRSGRPGELKGYFLPERCGNVLSNTECGVFGVLSSTPEELCEPIGLALRDKVVEGEAEIICTLGVDGAKKYKIEISKIDRDGTDNKNFVITVTDKALIERTGGIVQGMSGSPIIQNGKLVGAVTHVCVNL